MNIVTKCCQVVIHANESKMLTFQDRRKQPPFFFREVRHVIFACFFRLQSLTIYIGTVYSFHMTVYHFLIHFFPPSLPPPVSILASCNLASDFCRPNNELGGGGGGGAIRLSNSVKIQHMDSFCQRLQLACIYLRFARKFVFSILYCL